MDRPEGRLSRSIQRQLALGLSAATVAVAIVAGALSFLSALTEAHELQDDVLRQVAALVASQPPGRGLPPHRAQDTDPEYSLVVRELGVRSGDDPTSVQFPPQLGEGLQTVRVGAAGASYRVMVRARAGGDRVAVGQETRLRDEIARDSAIRTILPLLGLIPTLIAVMALLVRSALRPVARLSEQIDRRHEQDLQPLEPDRIPSEVRPFVVAINRLLGRLDQAMGAQRRFVADAAHELRSLMTALSLQAERLQADGPGGGASGRVAALRRGIERGRELLDQLLRLASAQATPVEAGRSLSVRQVFRQVLEDAIPLAVARRIDVGIVVAAHADIRVVAREADLVIVLRNLLDNAIRYTPAGGSVDLFAGETPAQVVLGVEDTGPGIPVAERARVFDPFYRVLGTGQEGSGLGLAIVAATVQRMGGRVELADATTHGRGLKVSIVLDKR